MIAVLAGQTSRGHPSPCAGSTCYLHVRQIDGIFMAFANCSIVSSEERITSHHESRGCPGKGFYCRPIPGVKRPRCRGRGQRTVVRRILLNAQHSNLHMYRIGHHLVLVNIRWFESPIASLRATCRIISPAGSPERGFHRINAPWLMLRPGVHLTHVDPTGLDPNRIVHDMIHDRVGQRTSVQPGTPIRLLVLRTENGGCSVIPPPYELDDESQQPAGWRIQKPLIHQQDATTGARGQNTGWL